MPQHPLRTITSDAVDAYLAAVRRTPLLSPAEEAALGRRIVQGDEQALHALVEHNLRFVVQVALKYQGHGLPLADLINEGNIGLMHAARKFDPERGTRFITYAVWWIRQAIMHALAAGGGAVRLPVKQAEKLAQLRRAFEALQRATGTAPSVEDVAQALAMPRDEVADLLRVNRPAVSLDAPLTEEGDMARLDLLSAEHLPSSEAAYVSAAIHQEVHDLLAHLEPRQAAILRARFGFNWLRVLLIGITSGNVRRKCTHMRLVHPLSARAKQAVIMRILSSTLARRAAYLSDGTTLSYCSWPPRWPRAVFALLKTRN